MWSAVAVPDYDTTILGHDNEESMSELFRAVCTPSTPSFFHEKQQSTLKTENTDFFNAIFQDPQSNCLPLSSPPDYSSSNSDDDSHSTSSAPSILSIDGDQFDLGVEGDWGVPNSGATTIAAHYPEPLTVPTGKRRKTASGGPRRLHACSWCPKKFVTTGHLKQHVRIHTGDRPFKCNWCDKAFAQCGDLKRHERIHTGEKPFKCNTCGKAFAQCGNLKKHERIHARDSKCAAFENTRKRPRSQGESERPEPAVSPLPDQEPEPEQEQEQESDDHEHESEHESDSPVQSPIALVPFQSPIALVPSSEPTSGAGAHTEGDKVCRLERSRQSARDGRIRKKQYVSELEEKVATMEARDVSLRSELDRVRVELAQLQAQHTQLLLHTGSRSPGCCSALPSQ